jgi:hypothetical protein
MPGASVLLDVVSDRFGRDPNRTAEERERAADFLARELYRDYPAMGWPNCQSTARNAAAWSG